MCRQDGKHAILLCQLLARLLQLFLAKNQLLALLLLPAGIFQHNAGSELRHCIDVIRRARLIQLVNQIFITDNKAAAQCRTAECLGQRFHHEDIFQCGGAVENTLIPEIHVRLIDNDQCIFQCHADADCLTVVKALTARIARIGENQNIRLFCLGAVNNLLLCQHKFAVLEHIDDFQLCDLCIELIHRKVRRQNHDLAAARRKGIHNQRNQLIRAVANNNIIWCNAEFSACQAADICHRRIRIPIEINGINAGCDGITQFLR